jgi:hypothetical protein
VPTICAQLQTSDGFKSQVLGFSPAVGKRDQVHAEAFDTGYFWLRDVATKSIAVGVGWMIWLPSASFPVCW